VLGVCQDCFPEVNFGYGHFVITFAVVSFMISGANFCLEGALWKFEIGVSRSWGDKGSG